MKARLRLTTTTLLIVIVAAPAIAQDSRADAIRQQQSDRAVPDAPDTRAQHAAAQRDDKAETITPPLRSPVERALYWYDVNGARVQYRNFHFTGGNFPGGAGFGYGVAVVAKAIGSPVIDPDAPNRIDADVSVARSVRGYQRVSARLDVRNVASVPVSLVLRAQDYQLTQEDFYGPGSDSTEAGRTNYRHDGQEYAVGATWTPSRAWKFGAEALYLTPSISRGTDSRYPTTQSRYRDLPGLIGLPEFIRADASAAFDWRDNATHPRRGGEYHATVSQFEGIDDNAFDFRRVDIGVQQIIPIFDRYRRLELRGGAMLTDAPSGAAVPFIYQPILGGASTLRGFHGSRFRDDNAAWGRAEYQWEAWWAMDAAVFVDAGQVAASRSDFRLRQFQVDYGIGFRIHSNSKFLARLDLAYGREGFLPCFGFKYGF